MGKSISQQFFTNRFLFATSVLYPNYTLASTLKQLCLPNYSLYIPAILLAIPHFRRLHHESLPSFSVHHRVSPRRGSLFQARLNKIIRKLKLAGLHLLRNCWWGLRVLRMEIYGGDQYSPETTETEPRAGDMRPGAGGGMLAGVFLGIS